MRKKYKDLMERLKQTFNPENVCPPRPEQSPILGDLQVAERLEGDLKKQLRELRLRRLLDFGRTFKLIVRKN